MLLWASCTINWDWDMIYVLMSCYIMHIYIGSRVPLHSSSLCVRAAKVENLTEYRNPPWHGVAAGDSLPRSFMELGNMKLMIEAFTLGKDVRKCWDGCAWFHGFVRQHSPLSTWWKKVDCWNPLDSRVCVCVCVASVVGGCSTCFLKRSWGHGRSI